LFQNYLKLGDLLGDQGDNCSEENSPVDIFTLGYSSPVLTPLRGYGCPILANGSGLKSTEENCCLGHNNYNQVVNHKLMTFLSNFPITVNLRKFK
jgi:hypothetical protein